VQRTVGRCDRLAVAPNALCIADVVNSVAFHPHLPLLATGSGTRVFDLDLDTDDHGPSTTRAVPLTDRTVRAPANSLALWTYEQNKCTAVVDAVHDSLTD
jgi:hypothetical protein